MPDFLALIIAIVLVAAPVWVLGWHYGARSLRNRHKRLIKLLENYNEEVKERNKTSSNNWYDGYAAGVSSTLTAFEVFLEKFKE
jgi:hypothetical protein